MSKIILSRPRGISEWIRVYRLYLSAFPANERKPFAIILNKYRNGKADVWCFWQNDRIVGFTSTINGEHVILLDYLAVDRKHRGQGVGSAALYELRKKYIGKGVFVEIENTREASSNQAERLRRKQFYLGCGMEDMNVTVNLFGVNMELMGWDCKLDYNAYHDFYVQNNGSWAASHVTPEQKKCNG